MTRVLIVGNMYPPHHLGGYELSCRDVAERWVARGHDVSVLSTRMRVPGVADPPGERQRRIWRDLDFYWDDYRLVSPMPWRRLSIERANQRALARAMRSAKPEVVSIWNMGAMSLALLSTLVELDVPLVFNVCDDWLVYGPRLDAWTRLFAGRSRLAALVRWLARIPTTLPDLDSAGAFLFVSATTKTRAEERTPWVFPVSTVVYSGIDLTDFPLVETTGARPWTWRLLYVGRLDERKGVDSIVRALAHLPREATLDIVGRGPEEERARLEGLARELGAGNRVRFAVAERSEMRARYRAADVVVFPSIWTEPFGLVPLEAMACATPVVATAVGGSSEFLEDGINCLRFSAGDAEALAAAVRRLADDARLRARLVAGGLRTSSELTVDRLADVLEAWHVAAAERFRHGRPSDRCKPVRAR